MEKKSLQERWNEETLTDNTQFNLCKQCKDCLHQSDGTIWTNRYDKSSCQQFPYPDIKPLAVIENEVNCSYRKIKE